MNAPATTALLIDIGNSRIKWRAIDTDGHPVGDHAALALDQLELLPDRWKTSRPDFALVSNVAGDRVGTLVDRVLRSIKPDVRIEHVVPVIEAAGVTNGYRDVAQLGPDRWLSMIGAHASWPDRSLLICSFGTATTIDLLTIEHDARAIFVGGMIMPGVDTMRRSLARDTARLALQPGKVVDFADNTDDAIASGIAGAQVGAINEALRHADSRCRTTPLACIVAGGASVALLDRLKSIDAVVHVVPDLVLQGLAVLARDMGCKRATSTDLIDL